MRKNEFFKMLVALSTLTVVAAFAVAVQVGAERIPLAILVCNALEFLFVTLCCAIIVLALFWAFKWWEKHPSYGALETRFQLFLCNRRKALAQKNAAQIAPALQYFLHNVLRRNKEVLGIDPGPDCGSLSPNGRIVAFRHNTLFYVFELVVPTAPEMELDMIKRIINQFVFSELNNYGAVNLPSYFDTSTGKAYPSIYLDRLTYDDICHTLIFEVLFVGSDQAANALVMAWERDKPKAAQPEIEVYEDEI